jgi:hypothetical protein
VINALFSATSARYQFEAPKQRHREIKVKAPSLITGRTTTELAFLSTPEK